jgi:outer membrane receptor protein involved in Fe transport
MASCCAIALFAPSALAQDAPATDDALKLSSVTVTATKREENIKDVPVSLTSLDETALATYG